MDTLMQADIFFFISSIGFVLITIGVLILVYYAIRAVRRFEEFTEVVEAHIEDAKDGVMDFKEDIKESLVYNFIFGKKKKKTKKDN